MGGEYIIYDLTYYMYIIVFLVKSDNNHVVNTGRGENYVKWKKIP